MGIVLMVFMVVGGVVANVGRAAEQGKIDKMVKQIKSQERESAVLQGLFEVRNGEMVMGREELKVLE
jgi:hypothetical protein